MKNSFRKALTPFYLTAMFLGMSLIANAQASARMADASGDAASKGGSVPRVVKYAGVLAGAVGRLAIGVSF